MGTNATPFLQLTQDAFKEIGGAVLSRTQDVLKLGDQQADARKGAIVVLMRMCDALQLACDLVSKELSAAIVEYYELKDQPERLYGYLQRVAARFSEGSLRVLLHEGRVCAELTALSDRFRQPFTTVVGGSLPWWEAVLTFFRRSNSMTQALNGITEGEMHYLNDFRWFLDDLRNRAEQAISIGDRQQVADAAEAIVMTMREKRGLLQQRASDIRAQAEACVHAFC